MSHLLWFAIWFVTGCVTVAEFDDIRERVGDLEAKVALIESTPRD